MCGSFSGELFWKRKACNLPAPVQGVCHTEFSKGVPIGDSIDRDHRAPKLFFQAIKVVDNAKRAAGVQKAIDVGAIQTVERLVHFFDR